MTTPITLRPPTFSSSPVPATYQSPTIAWLTETWHVTHSTLPMWKSKRNVKITYTPLAPSDPSIATENTDRLDDLVTYQSLSGDKVSQVRGIDTCALKSKADAGRDVWDWRGKGWLKIASSHWEVLGWGVEAESGNKWAVTVFAKTLFTPAGIDIYSQSAKGLAPQTLADIKTALTQVEDATVKGLAGTLFEVKID